MFLLNIALSNVSSMNSNYLAHCNTVLISFYLNPTHFPALIACFWIILFVALNSNQCWVIIIIKLWGRTRWQRWWWGWRRRYWCFRKRREVCFWGHWIGNIFIGYGRLSRHKPSDLLSPLSGLFLIWLVFFDSRYWLL